MTMPNVFPPTSEELAVIYDRLTTEAGGLTFGRLGNLMAVAQAKIVEPDIQQVMAATSDWEGEFMTAYRARATTGKAVGHLSVGLAREFRNSTKGAVLEEPTDLLEIFRLSEFHLSQGRRMRSTFGRMVEIANTLLDHDV